MASRVLVSGLPRCLPPLPPGPTPTCVPCVEGRQRAAPHSSEFPPTEAPLQTLHMDVWGPARVRGQGQERYFLLVVDEYSRYTTVFPLRSKGEVTEVLIDWICAARLRLRESFGSDFPVLRLHSDRGGEFSSALLGAFCRTQGIRQTFTLPASPQQNGIAERRIGMVMDVARTSMIHAAAPHFMWPFAVQYAAHQLNLQPRVSLPETSPTLLWTGKVGDASAFWFYHPTSRRVLSSQDVTFDESVPYYRLFPYRTASLPPPPLFLAPGPPPVDPLHPQGPAPSGVSQVDAVEPVEVAVDLGAATGAEPAGAGSGGAGSGGAEPGGAETGGADTGGAEPGGAEPGGAGSARVASRGASSRREVLLLLLVLAVLELLDLVVLLRLLELALLGVRLELLAVLVLPVLLGLELLELLELELQGVLALVVLLTLVRPRVLELVLLELEVLLALVLLLGVLVLGLPPSPGPLECPQPVPSLSLLQPVSPLPAPSPYTGPTGGLAERRAPASRPA
ncbi:unnamed protein product, partial [Closterium sp. NIES-53]